MNPTAPAQLPTDDPRHGRPSTYTNHRCRCDQCRGAWADYMRARRRPSESTPEAAKVALIRSIAGHAAGREADALAEIAAVLGGATLEELAAMRAGA